MYFWMVWNPNGRSPTFKHETEESALSEARRLAGLNSGHRFYVLRAEHYFEKDDVKHVELDGIPF
jgi:hypothetical protein